MFGRGRVQNGVLVQPAEEFDPRDEARLEAFRNQIWCAFSVAVTTSYIASDICCICAGPLWKR